MAEDSLFDDHDMTTGPDLVKRQAVRRQVLGGILQVIRARNSWSVSDAAAAASIAPMTWRRLEEGLDVRQRTLTALDGLLGQPFGTVRRALDDDGVMTNLVGLTELDTPPVDPADVEGFLDELAERFRTGSVRHVTTRATVAAGASAFARAMQNRGAASANLGGLTASAGGLSPEREREMLAQLAAASVANYPSAITLAAQLVDRITRETMTPAIENAVAAILAAMPDLVARGTLHDAVPAVDVLSQSPNKTLHQAAAEIVKQATEEAIEKTREQEQGE